MDDYSWTIEFNGEVLDYECANKGEVKTAADNLFDNYHEGEGCSHEGYCYLILCTVDDHGELIIDQRERYDLFYSPYVSDRDEHFNQGAFV